MASNIKYTGNFKDSFGSDVLVSIFVDGYAGSNVYDLEFGAEPVVIDYKGDDSDFLQPIITSEATLELMLNKTNIFLTDLINLKENKFFVKIDKYDGATLEYRWIGYIIPDQLNTSFTYLKETVKLSCVCPMTIFKGIRLEQMSTNVLLYGRTSFKSIFDGAIQRLGAYDVLTSPAVNFGYDLFSNMSLTPDYLTNLLNDVGVNIDGLIDSDGRGFLYYDIFKDFATSFTFQIFFENGKLVMTDLENKFDSSKSFVSKKVSYKEAPSFDRQTMVLLLSNSEEVSYLPALRQTASTFKYTDISGNILNSWFRQWGAVAGGFLLSGWNYSPQLSSSPTARLRRLGNGRTENPYRFNMNGDTYLDLDQYEEGIAGKLRYEINSDELFSIKMDCRLIVDRELPPSIAGGGDDRLKHWFSAFRCCTVAFNLDDARDSMILLSDDRETTTDKTQWYRWDLNGTSFQTSDSWDFINLNMTPISDYTYFLNRYKMYNFMFSEMDRGGRDVSLSFQYPKLEPMNPRVGGVYNRFRIFHYISNPYSAYRNSSSNYYQVYPAEIIKCELEFIDESEGNGMVTYVSRVGEQSLDVEPVEIGFTPTLNKGVVGAIQSLTTFTISSQLYRPQFIINLYRYNDSGGGMFGRLTTINARSVMRLKNSKQVKINVDCNVRVPSYKSRYDFSVFVDGAIPFTNIYKRVYSATRMVYNMKDNNFNATFVGCENIPLPPSFTNYDETKELVEEYIN